MIDGSDCILQRIASIGLLLVPAIKRAVYINTYSNYSQPVLTKLYNEILVGIFTSLQRYTPTAKPLIVGPP